MSVTFLKKLIRRDKNELPGLILKPAYDLSDRSISLGSKIQCLSSERYTKRQPTWNPLSRDVLRRTHEQEITYHRAVLCLAETGWAHTAHPILKAMIEGIVNGLVVVKADSEFRAFKKLVFEGFRIDVDDATRDKALRHIREAIMPHLNEEDRRRGEKYLKQTKPGLYWYQDEYRGPREVIRREAPKLMLFYDVAASASHGGQLGYKFFDSDWGSENISPRKDPFSANFVVSESIRLLIEFSSLRNQFEKLGQHAEYLNCLKELNKGGFKFLTQQDDHAGPHRGTASSAPCEAVRSRGFAHA